MPREPIIGLRQVLAIPLIVVAGWAYIWAMSPAVAQPPAFVAVALVCPPGISGSDCSRENALDMAVQPVEHETQCGLIGQVLASHLGLQPGETHKIACERRKG